MTTIGLNISPSVELHDYNRTEHQSLSRIA